MSIPYHKLDNLLNKYFDDRPNSTTPHEKETAFNLYKNLCSKHGVNAEAYIKTRNPNNSTRSRREQTYSNSYSTWTSNDFEDIFNDFWKRAKEEAKRKKEEEYRKEKEAQQKRNREQEKAKSRADDHTYDAYRYAYTTENTNKTEESTYGWWDPENRKYYRFKIKDILFEEAGYKNGKRVIFFSALACREGSDRWGITDFCIYTEHNMNDFFPDSVKEFEIVTGKVKYYRTRYALKELRFSKDGVWYEQEIY